MIFGASMYASYFALFVQFALNRFVYQKGKQQGSAKTKIQ